MKCDVFTFYRQNVPEGQLCRYCFYSRADFGIFSPQGRTTRCSDQGEIWQKEVRSSLPNFTWLAQGCGFTAPKTLKIWNFTNIIALKGRTPCAILIKFAGFMRICSLHKTAKVGWITSINDKIIDNLPLWGRFQPNFRLPLRLNYWWDQCAK